MMKISKSKRQLAQLLIEAGVKKFPNGADWAAQGSLEIKVSFYGGYKPKRGFGEAAFCGSYCGSRHDVQLPSLINNWHQTVLSRDEFDQIVAENAPDADGWIEWKGGECPVGRGTFVDIKDADGKEWLAVKASPQDEYSDAANVFWEWNCTENNKIVAYRLHKPEVKPEFCESVMRSIPEPESHEKLSPEAIEDAKFALMSESIEESKRKPTIEQLAADYRNAKECAGRKQQEADDAKADAEVKLAELVAAGNVLGLVIDVRH